MIKFFRSDSFNLDISSVAAKYAIANNIKYVYLNKPATDDTNKKPITDDTDKPSKDDNSNTGTNTSDKKEDTTIARGKIPQTGEENYILIPISAIIVLSVIFYIKYMQYRKNV